MDIFESEPDIKCSRCDYHGIQSTYPQKKNLSYKKHCFDCDAKLTEEREAKRAARDTPSSTTEKKCPGPKVQPLQGHATLEWHECVSLLTAHKNDVFELEAFVLMVGESAVAAFVGRDSAKDIADTIAQRVWDTTGYRFIYKKSKKSTRSDSVKTYTYYCAQNDAEVKKADLHDNTRKRRARMKMDRFPCQGTLQITVDDENLDMPLRLKIKHHKAHLHYVDININKKIKTLVESLRNESATNIWTRVLRENPDTEVTQKQIYALWRDLNQGAWHLDDDQVKSAQIRGPS